MRIAALSDVHGNAPALEAVLADIRRQEVDLVVNLGDVLSGPLWPAETVRVLAECGWEIPTVLGNHDRAVTTSDRAEMSASDAFAYDSLSPREVDWLASAYPSLEVAEGVLAVHGTPTSDTTYLLETVTHLGPRPATPDEVLARLGEDTWPSLVLCGHSHQPRELRLPSGTLVVNPGSVGLPGFEHDDPYPHVMQSGVPHARYAVLEDGGELGWEVELIGVVYDWEAAADRAAANGRDDWAHALRTGRALQLRTAPPTGEPQGGHDAFPYGAYDA